MVKKTVNARLVDRPSDSLPTDLRPIVGWIIFANILLGINQGLTWSSTVIMKIDLVGEKNQGLAMGLGTAVVYPTFLAAIADYAHPQQRVESIGVFRLWRDLGYAIGALLTGIIADYLSLNWALGAIGFLTILSSIIILIRMQPENQKGHIKPLT